MQLIYAMLLLVVMSQPALAQDCTDVTDDTQLAECLNRRVQQARCNALVDAKHRAQCLLRGPCIALTDDSQRVQCLRAVLALPTREELCNTDVLKADSVACLELRVDSLAKELWELRRALPGLIEAGVAAALQPRVHK